MHAREKKVIEPGDKVMTTHHTQTWSMESFFMIVDRFRMRASNTTWACSYKITQCRKTKQQCLNRRLKIMLQNLRQKALAVLFS